MENVLFLSDSHPNAKYIRNELRKNLTKTSECSDYINIKDLFLSDENIDLINKKLILTVWRQSNYKYKIGNQSKDKLIVVMLYIYEEYGRNLPFNIKEQITDLNKYTINSIVPDIMTNIDQYFGYLRDIEKRQPLVDYPVASRRSKNLVSKSQLI